MHKNILSSIGAGIVGLMLTISPGFSAENHKAEAMKHVQAAMDSGKSGNATAVGEHASMAKVHVDAAIKEKANPHLDMANKSLDSAIEHSKMGHADIAGKAAEEAATHLKAAE
jgi:predicted aldo/keto reductase-like oxidoreductase